MIFQKEIAVDTPGRSTTDLTAEVQQIVAEAGIRAGTCQVFVRHTSASLLLCENADPDVRRDLEAFMQRLVPDGDSLYRHQSEGPDDMPAHVRCVLTSSSLNLPVADGACALGTWQGIYLWEHRARAHCRRVFVTVQGEL